eukprot:tig00020904_g15156.t1
MLSFAGGALRRTHGHLAHALQRVRTPRLPLVPASMYASAAPAPLGTKPKSKPPHPSESFLTGTNSVVLEQMYEMWKADPASVHKSWDTFFRNIDAGLKPGEAYLPPARPVHERGPRRILSAEGEESLSKEFNMTHVEESVRVLALLRSYRERGSLMANLDPLGLVKPQIHPDLDPASFGFTEEDMDREFYLGGELGRQSGTLREILTYLQDTYCKTFTVEYMHISDKQQKFWIRSRVELAEPYSFTPAERKSIYTALARADGFERFLAAKYNTAKRFGLEGGESVICGIDACLERAAELGVENVCFGMPHRGRLNVLANIMEKPLAQIFSEFQTVKPKDESMLGSGDVKYHLGTSGNRHLSNGMTIHASLAANPSHLEAVDPVVIGKARAKQHFRKDAERAKTMAVLLHGDAAFAGQGVVAETLELSDLVDYTTGGTIHIVVNNQIGFTTDPRKARSSPFCSDVAKIVGAPIFHVNGDDPEAVVRACRIAAEWRQTFKKDVVVDIVCYRRHGHNELDQPAFTQPRMYKQIAKHPPTVKLYAEYLDKNGYISKAETDAIVKSITQNFEAEFEKSKTWKGKTSDWLSTNWHGFKSWLHLSKIRPTGTNIEVLKRVGLASCQVPAGFKIHPKIKEILDARKKMLESGEGLDWATCEQLAFGTLLLEGFHVRVSGQDCERGTFSHRHAVLHDQETDEEYVPLDFIDKDQADFHICNSNLSEFAVLGFEHGYSLESPYQLTIWEAQFGDFANGAQIIIDQFIVSGENKWLRQSGLVMLLPHGYDGQGPEHSSSRLERFLQLSDESPDEIPVLGPMSTQIQERNIQVVNCTTPANFFHVLRRQLHREFRKPLIVMSPKALLRNKKCVSPLEDLAPGTMFQKMIRDTSEELAADEKVRRVILCSGKVYYDLADARAKRGIKDVAIARIEQIAPFPFDLVGDELLRFKNAEIVWVQEEPQNMGAWFYIEPRVKTALRPHGDTRAPRFIGRKAAAAPATGFFAQHEKELQEILDGAFAEGTNLGPVAATGSLAAKAAGETGKPATS